MAMVHKNITLKRTTKFGLVMDILFPVLIGYVFWNLADNFKSLNSDPNSDEYK